MRRKLGLFGEEAEDTPLIHSLLEWMQKTGADYTLTFRDLIADNLPPREAYQSPDFQQWHETWKARLLRNPEPLQASFLLMQNSNPVIIPRNHHVEDALAAAEEGDLTAFRTLLNAVQNPYAATESNTPFRTPPPHAAGHYRTFCGT